mgnify:CR=1 FL=1
MTIGITEEKSLMLCIALSMGLLKKKSLNAMHSIIHGITKAKSLMLYIALSICDDMSLQWFMLSSFFFHVSYFANV